MNRRVHSSPHWQLRYAARQHSSLWRPFSSFPHAQACSSSHTKNSHHGNHAPDCQDIGQETAPTQLSQSVWNTKFWYHRPTWKRASINTLRCLVGCTVGDFSALWILQNYCPELGMGTIMMASMASGITSSIILETILLRRGADQLSWPMAARTAMGMSVVSMVAMEAAENIVDYHLTGGVVALGDPRFWMAAVLSIGAGFLAPLPYNYLRLRKYGRACH